MSPDDPRHGTLTGYQVLRCRCARCTARKSRYEKRRRLLVLEGTPLRVEGHGFRRRVRALMAIGWTQQSVADALGIAQGNLSRKLLSTYVSRATHEAMCSVYAERCMSVQHGPQADRTRREMAALGHPPPLAWDDIDDVDEQPSLRVAAGEVVEEYDQAVVERILAGEWRLPASYSDRVEVVRIWRSEGRSLALLRRRTGWKPERYYVAARVPTIFDANDSSADLIGAAA